MYGDKDWVKNIDQDSPHKVIEANKVSHGDKSAYYLISNSGHNLHTDNPIELVDNII
jgi:pimeloyl-ACP methyl ester carboxylesterase